MRTAFTPEQLADPHMKGAEQALRKCVHCGFCTATCPTYLLLGDERDSPRGRIMLMQHMLESDAPPSSDTVRHIDRCLSCLGCRTTCPSGVDYAALVDTARVHIAKTYRRPFGERLFRTFVLRVLMTPALFSVLTSVGRIFGPIARQLPGRIGKMAVKIPLRQKLRDVHRKLPETNADMRRIALLEGCAQKVLAPGIDLAARRMLARTGAHAEPLEGAGCCGALALHMGDEALAKKSAKRVIEAFEAEDAKAPLAAALSTATGCAAFLKDYDRLFAGDAEWETRAKNFSARMRDFTELAEPLAQPPNWIAFLSLNVAYHPPCSLQHAQRLQGRGEALLSSAGFRLTTFADPHLCCGSAGSYSLLQPEISEGLRAKKLASIRASGASVIASGNAGCLTQLSGGGNLPAIHIAELLDWAGGGPRPVAMGEE